jgi:hypothetical protein
MVYILATVLKGLTAQFKASKCQNQFTVVIRMQMDFIHTEMFRGVVCRIYLIRCNSVGYGTNVLFRAQTIWACYVNSCFYTISCFAFWLEQDTRTRILDVGFEVLTVMSINIIVL